MIKPIGRIALCTAVLLQSMTARSQDYCINGRFDNFYFDSLQVETLSDIPYGAAVAFDGSLVTLDLDVYEPIPAIDPLAKRPLIIFFHGGGFDGGDKTSEGASYYGEKLAEKGFVFASANYRIGWDNLGSCEGDTTSLQLAIYRAIQDGKAAIRFMKAHASEYGIDTNYIFLMGNSAGTALSLNAAYAGQENFDDPIYSSLGSLDSSTNALYNHTVTCQGISVEAAGIENVSVLDNADIPVEFFHGTCDSTVPYDTGPLYYCYSPVQYMTYHGSWYLSHYLESKGTVSWLYSAEHRGHDAVDEDTIVLYAGLFFKDILCGTAHNENFYRYSPGGCLITDKGIHILAFYPNPFTDVIHISFTTFKDGTLDIKLYDALGQLVYSNSLDYFPPLVKFDISLQGDAYSRGLYVLELSSGNYSDVEKLIRW